MKPIEQQAATTDLLKTFLLLRNIEEARGFIRDLCTPEEIKDMTDRWQIVQRIDRGDTYRTIAQDLKVSTTTVSRVAQWLMNGTGGYRTILQRSQSHHRPTKPVGRGVR